jgi:hypothetical protein
MANKEVAFKIVVDTSEVGASVKKTTKGVEELGEATKKTTKEMGGGFSAAADNAKQLGGQLGGATGAALGFAAGIKSMTLAALAFLATPLGMALAAIGVVVGSIIGIFKTFFGETERGAQKLRVIMAGLGAVMGSLKDVIIGVAEAMIKFVKGDFSGSINALKNSFTGLGDEIAKDVKSAIALEEALNNLKVSNRELEVDTANLRAEIKRLNKDAEDIGLSFEKRAKAARDAGKIEEELLARRLANAEEEVRIIKTQNALNETNEEAMQKLADAEIKRANLKAESLELQTTLQNKLNTIEQQIEAERTARATAEQARIKDLNEKKAAAAIAELERLKKETEELEKQAEIKFSLEDKVAAREVEIYQQLQDAKLALMEEGEAKELALADLILERRLEGIMGANEMERQLRDQLEAIGLIERQAIIDKYNKEGLDKEKAHNKKIKDEEEKLKNIKIQAALDVGSALGSIASAVENQGKAGLAASKVLAISELAISTAVSIGQAIAGATSAASAGGPAAPFLLVSYISTMVGTVVGAIASATSMLNKVPAGGSAVTPSVNVSSASAAPPSFNPVTTNTTDLGNTNQAELMPIQAFVVETQVTGSQNNINQIQGQAEFGGG